MSAHHTDVVLRNIARYLDAVADGIERDAKAGRAGDARPDYLKGAVDGVRGAAKRIREDWVTPTGRFHDTPVLRLVRNQSKKEETESKT